MTTYDLYEGKKNTSRNVELCCFFQTFYKCLKAVQSPKQNRVRNKVESSGFKSEREREGRERERGGIQTNYTRSSHKPRVIQSPCTSKRFHYSLIDYKFLKYKILSLLNHTRKILMQSNLIK